MKITVTFEVDDTLVDACRAAYAKRMATATTLEVLARSDKSTVTLQQWDDAKKATDDAYYDWSKADEAMRKAAEPVRRSLLDQFDARVANLPKPSPRDKLVPDEIRVRLDGQKTEAT